MLFNSIFQSTGADHLRWLMIAMDREVCKRDDFSDCNLGSITGTWRTHYDETNGNCGAIPDETNISTSTTMPSDSACTVTTNVLSDDKCHLDRQFECPTTDGLGTQSWTSAITQTAAGRIEGSATVQLQHPSIGTCRSTYNVTITQL